MEDTLYPNNTQQTETTYEESRFDYQKFYEGEAVFKRFSPEADARLIKRVRLIMSLMHRKKVSSILDAGCGDGYLCGELMKTSGTSKITGCDLSETRVSVAQQLLPNIEFKQGNIYSLPFADNSYDLVIASEVLEHLEEPDRAFRELVRVSKKFIIVTVPDNERLKQVLCPHCMKNLPLDGHIQSFNPDSLEKLCASVADTERIETSYLNQVNPVVRRLLKLLAKQAFPRFLSGGYLGLLAKKKGVS